ncbi:protein DJ-1 homolog B [Fagus crenata]
MNGRRRRHDERTVEKKAFVLIPIANGTEPMEAMIVIDVLRLLPCEITVPFVEKELLDAAYERELDWYSNEIEHGISTIGNECISMYFDTATCSPFFFMEQLAPNAIALESNVQVDARVVTSRGPTTTMEFAVKLVKQLYDERVDDISKILGICKDLVHFNRMIELNPVRWSFVMLIIPGANGSFLESENAAAPPYPPYKKMQNVVMLKQLFMTKVDICGVSAFLDSKKLVNLLRQQRKDDKPYGAIGESLGLVLQYHGLLKKATVSPLWCELLGDDSEAEYGTVVDGKLITSQGPGTTIEFANAIVERLIGLEFSVAILRELSGNTDAIS